MLGNSIDKMLLISSSTTTTNQWPQNQIDEKSSSLMPPTMEKSQPPQSQHQPPPPPQQALKCPRCDSSNTKFCYYNNYSLSQPRHFCKACKRYWTRGGTLRNVPVGGGCRKNKRVKRASSASSSAVVEGVSSATPNLIPNSSSRSQIDISIPTSNTHQMNPLFYGLHSNPSELNLPLFNSGIDTGYDLNAVALGFSSGKQIQDSNYSIFGSSLLGSGLVQQQKFNTMKDSNLEQTVSALTPFEELHMNGNTEYAGMCNKEVKVELQDQQSKFDWNNHNQNQMDPNGFSSLDPSLYWNPNSSTNSVGAIWHDPANFGSSLTSLI